MERARSLVPQCSAVGLAALALSLGSDGGLRRGRRAGLDAWGKSLRCARRPPAGLWSTEGRSRVIQSAIEAARKGGKVCLVVALPHAIDAPCHCWAVAAWDLHPIVTQRTLRGWWRPYPRWACCGDPASVVGLAAAPPPSPLRVHCRCVPPLLLLLLVLVLLLPAVL